MSLDVDGPLPWRWNRLQIPKRMHRAWSNFSPVFRFENIEWYLECEKTSYGTILLRLQSGSVRFPSFIVSVRVESSRGEGPYSDELLDIVDDWTSWPPVVWERETDELERLLPQFRRDRLLTFWIAIKEKDPQRDIKFAPATARLSTSTGRFPCRKTRSKTFTDASVQTTLTADCISSLDTMSGEIAKMQDSSSNPDVELHCAGQTAMSHKNVLCVRSPVLAQMIQSIGACEGKTRVVYIPDMSAGTFRLFLKYLHSGKLEIDALDFDVALRLYEAGRTYGVKSLVKRCCQFLSRNLTVQNVCDALAVASTHGDKELSKAATVYLLKKKIPQSGSERWLEFCRSNPVLANDVYHRYVRVLSGCEPPRKKRCAIVPIKWEYIH